MLKGLLKKLIYSIPNFRAMRDDVIFLREENERLLQHSKTTNDGNQLLNEEISFLKFRNEELDILHDEVVERQWNGDEHRKDFVCTHPFERIEILPRGEVYTCCSAHLKHNYYIGNIYEQDFDEIWNSDKAKKLRYSVAYGNFEYCNRYCKWIHVNHCLQEEHGQFEVGESTPIRARGAYDTGISAATYHECGLKTLPKYISLSCDVSCNLICETCRNQLDVLGKEKSDRLYQVLMEKIRPALANCETLDALGSGEFFASKAVSDFFKSLNQAEFPNLKLFIITNGQLFTKERWNEFENLHEFPLRVAVSVDAARKETYEKIRRGAKWVVLCENIKFIKTLNNLKFLCLNFVIQKDNWAELEEFMKFAIDIGADAVELQKLNNWGTFDEDEFLKKDVLGSKNEDEKSFKLKLKKIIQKFDKDINIIQNIL